MLIPLCYLPPAIRALTDDQSCWHVGETESHPNADDCPDSGRPLPVSTNGHLRWIACPVCARDWWLEPVTKRTNREGRP